MNTSNGFSKAVNSINKKESIDEAKPNQESDSHERYISPSTIQPSVLLTVCIKNEF